MQSQQLPTESQVLQDEVLPGTETAYQPTEEISERHDHFAGVRGFGEAPRNRQDPHLFVSQRYANRINWLWKLVEFRRSSLLCEINKSIFWALFNYLGAYKHRNEFVDASARQVVDAKRDLAYRTVCCTSTLMRFLQVSHSLIPQDRDRWEAKGLA